MRKNSWLALILFFVLYPAAGAVPDDTAVTIRINGKTASLPWSPVKVPIPYSTQAALHGEFGISLDHHQPFGANRALQIPMQQEIWHRFYFRVDSFGYNPDSLILYKRVINDSFPASFYLGLHTLEQPVKERDLALIRSYFAFRRKDGSLFLTIHGGGPENANVARIPINLKQVHCLETHILFPGQDSAAVEVFMDGVSKKAWKTLYPYARNYFRITLQTDYLESNAYWKVALDDVAFSDTRLNSIPPTAGSCSTQVEEAYRVMACAPPSTGFQGERITQSRWQLFNDTTSLFPLYDVVETAPRYITQRKIPFLLTDGEYYWRNGFQNNFNTWGDWSKYNSFTIKDQAPPKAEVLKAFFSEIQKNKPLHEIVAGKWYDFNLVIRSAIPFDSLGYAIVWINDTSYTLGHIVNKGGRFLSKSNYVFNAPLHGKKYGLFEKNIEGEAVSKPLSPEKSGLYLDMTKDNLVVDASNGTVRLRARVLENASEGGWNISAAIVYPVGLDSAGEVIEHNSNIFRSSIVVIQQKSNFGGAGRIVLSVIITGLGIFLFVYFRRKRFSPEATGVEDGQSFQQISAYISGHIAQKIMTKDVLSALHIGEKQFYAIMAKNNHSLPTLINKIRIDKAKLLLEKNQEMNIEEISFSVGYKTSTHFATIFKKLEGLSPTDYRVKFTGNLNKIPGF